VNDWNSSLVWHSLNDLNYIILIYVIRRLISIAEMSEIPVMSGISGMIWNV